MRGNETMDEFSSIVGSAHTVTDAKLLYEAQTSTYKTDQKILGIVKPGSVTEIQKILKLARQQKTPLYAYSTGKNWGYGSRVPKTNGSLLVDLSRMKKITDYSEELGYVTVEPGVTQKQLHDFLKRKKSPFSLSLTGSAPDTSIIGNICERGVGAGPYGFRSRHISNLEVILPSGECIHTGFGRFAGAKAAEAYPEGVGPSFYDMFLQSNLGIITKLTIFLAPTPTYAQFVGLSVTEDKDLPKCLSVLRTFNLYSMSHKSIVFRKDLQMLFTETQYPWGITNGETPLPAQVADQLKKKYGIDFAWKAIAAIYAYTWQELDAQISHFKSLTEDMDGIEISPIFTENTLGSGPKELGNSLYWRMKTPPPAIKDPDTDGCGVIRLSVAVPFIPADITRVIETMTSIITRFKYEPFIEGHCVSARTVVVIAPIIFDRTVPGEDENALACHDALLKTLMEAGYYPYRDNGRAVDLLPGSSDEYDTFQTAIKTALDPDSILSPGRYEVQ